MQPFVFASAAIGVLFLMQYSLFSHRRLPLKAKSVQLQTKLHTEKCTAPFVATQTFAYHREWQSGEYILLIQGAPSNYLFAQGIIEAARK